MNPTRSILSSAVLPLRLTFADGYRLQASASVVGTNDLLTATHVLYQPQHGGWATGLAVLGTQMMSDGQVSLDGTATSISGWQVWANPQQVYADTDPTTLTLGESQYDVALIGVDRLLDQSGLTLAGHADAQQGSGLGYAGGQNLSRIDTGLQQGQDGYSVFGSTDSTLGPGSSGGPLLDGAGQIIGVNSSGTPGQATWWADIGPFLPQLTEQMQANDALVQATGPFPAGPVQISTGTTLPDLPATGQETITAQLPNAIASTNMVGGEFRVNSYIAHDQVSPAITALADGGWLVTWASLLQDGGDWGVYAQRYSSNGSAQGGEFRVNITTASDQSNPAVTALADGGYVVTWESNMQDGYGLGIYARRYASNGSTVDTEFRVNSSTANNESAPAITALADGGYAVTWQDQRGESWPLVGADNGKDGSLSGIFTQRYASNGSAPNGLLQVNSYTAGDQIDSAITALVDGGYVVTWQSHGIYSQESQDGSGWGIYAQRYASNGSAVGGEFRVNSTTANDQDSPALSALADGGYVVAWESYGQDGSGYGIYAQRFASNGSAVGGEFRVNSTTADHQRSPAITALSDGGYVVTWQSFDQDGWGIYAQRYAAQAEAPSSLSISAVSPSVSEGSGGGTTPASFTVSRSGSTSNSASVQWAMQPGSADVSDFSGSTSGSISFAAGEISKTITLNINGDNIAEPDETFSVLLSNPTGATLASSNASMTIVNDDGSATQAEGVLYRCAKYNGTYFYTANPQEVQYIQDNYLDVIRFEGYAFSCLTSGGKAVYRFALLDGSGADFYTADPNERSYVAAQTGKYRDEGIQFYAAQDNDSSATPVYRLKNPATGGYLFTGSEAEKNAAVSLYGYTFEQIAFKVPTAGTPSGFALAAGQDSQFAAEGTGTGGSLKYNVIRIGDSSGPASVQWSIVKGAGANPAGPDDFSGGAYPGGTLSFGANETSKIITVPFSGDNTAEFDETFYVTLSNPQGEQVLVGSMAGRIVNDDASSGGGNHAPATAAASVTLGNTSGYVFKVADFPFSDVDGDTLQAVVLGSLPATGKLMLGGGAVLAGTSVSRADLEAGKLAYSPAFGFNGQTGFAFQVTDATLASASADMVLKVGDQTSGTPALSIQAQYPTFNEGSGGGALPVPLDITRSSGTGVTTVDWAVVFGTADSGDFSGSTSGSVTFAAGETSKTITLQVNKDSKAEANETFSVQLKNPVNATLATGSANETILDDDSQPASTFQFKSLNKPAQASEGTGAGNEGSLSYDVLRTGDLQAAGSVKWRVVPAGADPAEANDFLDQHYPSGTLQFAANESSKTITVTFAPDELKGGNETFSIQLSDAVNGIVSSQAASMDGTILNDDTSRGSKEGDAFEGDHLYALQFGANEVGWGHGAMDGGWLL